MTGILFSSMAIGSLIATLLSGWSSRIQHQGRVVVIAAIGWGLFILCADLAPTPSSGASASDAGDSVTGALIDAGQQALNVEASARALSIADKTLGTLIDIKA